MVFNFSEIVTGSFQDYAGEKAGHTLILFGVWFIRLIILLTAMWGKRPPISKVTSNIIWQIIFKHFQKSLKWFSLCNISFLPLDGPRELVVQFLTQTRWSVKSFKRRAEEGAYCIVVFTYVLGYIVLWYIHMYQDFVHMEEDGRRQTKTEALGHDWPDWQGRKEKERVQEHRII